MNLPSPVGVVGLGLIGGSFALACRRLGLEVCGWDRDQETCTIALDTNAVTKASTDAAILRACRVVLIAVPVCSLPPVLTALRALAEHPLAWFDAGSTKQNAIASAKDLLGSDAKRFVPCHPIAGAEHNGIRAARADLFQDKRVIMCPQDCAQNAKTTVGKLWTALGAKISTLQAAEHDRLFAAVSHLPHILAYALVGAIGKRPDRDQLLLHAASGFKDFTRIASSDPSMWRDVCLSNRSNLLAVIDEFNSEVQDLRSAIAAGDAPSMHEYFQRMRYLRNNWQTKQQQ